MFIMRYGINKLQFLQNNNRKQ